MKLLLKWLLSAAALMFVAYLYPGVQVTSLSAALVAALVIGLQHRAGPDHLRPLAPLPER